MALILKSSGVPITLLVLTNTFNPQEVLAETDTTTF